MNNKPHLETTVDDYKAYASYIREDAQSRGVENTRLSIYGIYMAVVEKQAAELERYETARQEDARRLATVTAELEAMREAAKEANDRLRMFRITSKSSNVLIWDRKDEAAYQELAAALKGGKG